jgi:hypothetical protein
MFERDSQKNKDGRIAYKRLKEIVSDVNALVGEGMKWSPLKSSSSDS